MREFKISRAEVLQAGNKQQRTAPNLGVKTGKPNSQPRTSGRRGARIDFSRLEAASLRRYKRYFRLRDANSGTKEDLVPAVTKHFASYGLPIEENDLKELITLVSVCLKKNANASTPPPAPRKPTPAFNK
eukprot:jgi/Mesvir1/5938/Mv00703-RA.1